ncbi:uncharacterized protein LOC8059861 [Sorghum bicolor]|uniref:Uncharacterized protein n=1 Tax=Sorghum bicolor TaxID=4558 RepID=C5X7Y7_SORBI|nr:uncharacterized protein LOC8059861 [Sorghum bicolor]EER97877.2 hypothetical protein SORBI_3002G014200 [Sorghum bicolor]|eukprot:XP_002461356.2 uncharacterized protein LOC8059861 [Sorghum bicolor]
MPPPPPVLVEEHVEEILLRFSPQHPAFLFRAALVCKRWCRLISSPGFRRRYREFHRTPPMLAILVNAEVDSDGSSVSRFVPGRPAFCLPLLESRRWRVLDARHGRVLTRRVGREPAAEAAGVELQVCDPITMERRMVPIPSPRVLCLAAAVLCSSTPDAGACDHLDCHRGPFLVVFVGCLHLDRRTFIYTFSSETAAWNGPIFTQLSISATPPRMTSKCVGNALYFGFPMSDTILKYDLQSGHISGIEFPTECSFNQSNVFITTEGGGLGIASVHHYALHTWSRDDAVGWMQTRAIEIQSLLPVDTLLGSAEPRVAGFADRFGMVFLLVNNVLYLVHLSTYKATKIFRGIGISINSVVPYMNFYTPALGASCTNEGPSAGGSSA